MKYVINKENIVWSLDKEEEIVCLNLDSGVYYGINNETGKDIWLFLQEPKTQQEIVQYLYEMYDVEITELENDCRNILEELKTNNLLILVE